MVYNGKRKKELYLKGKNKKVFLDIVTPEKLSKDQILEIKNKSIDLMFEHTNNPQYNEERIQNIIEEMDKAIIARDSRTKEIIGIAAVSYIRKQELKTFLDVLFIHVTAIDDDYQSNRLATSLNRLLVKEYIGKGLLKKFFIVMRSSNPRAAALLIDYCNGNPKPNIPISSATKDLASILANYFYPNDEFIPEKMLFPNCYEHGSGKVIQVDWENFKTKNNEINEFFFKDIFFSKNGDIFRSSSAFLFIGTISVMSLIKYYLKKKYHGFHNEKGSMKNPKEIKRKNSEEFSNTNDPENLSG